MNIIDLLNTENGFNEICSDFNIDSAKACVIYKLVSEESTAGGVISSSLKHALRGFLTPLQVKDFQ